MATEFLSDGKVRVSWRVGDVWVDWREVRDDAMQSLLEEIGILGRRSLDSHGTKC